MPACEVWAFGSRATGKAKSYLDLDLVIVDTAPLPLEVAAALAEDLRESELPWKVDVVDWATAAAGLRDIIRRGRVVVQLPGAEADRI